MSLTKTKLVDKVEFVGKYKKLQVRYVTEITEGENIIAQSYDRDSYTLDIGIENLPEELQPYATGVWTDELLAELEAENAEWHAQQQALEETE